MATIYRENADRLSVADAKRLILEALPPETSVECYARVDENGEIDFEGQVELKEVHGIQLYASFLDRDFPSICEQLSIKPRMKYRPVFTDYTWKSPVDDAFYTITHNEFSRVAELFDLTVALGPALEAQEKAPTNLPGEFGEVMKEIAYWPPMFTRLEPRTPFQGGRITDTDVLNLTEAARFASVHAGAEMTPSDFLRAAGRGEITLRAIVHQTAKLQKIGGGVYCNAGQPNENTVPNHSILNLPVSACQQLAATGRASWRKFDGFEQIDGVLMRYAIAELMPDESDFETTTDDCRVTGNAVNALADAFFETPAQTATTPAPVVADAPAKRIAKKPSIETVALDYMRKTYKAGYFQSAAKFHKHLIKTAGVADSPFEMATGDNARKLFCPAASSFYDVGTLGKLWAKIRVG